MCGNNKGNMNWKREPDSEGDWLWLRAFGCGCVIQSGIAYVSEWEEPEQDDGYRDDIKINGFCVSFGPKNKPEIDPKDIKTWLKLNLPTELWFDDEMTNDPTEDY